MTVIEFFDRWPVENMLSCLTLVPQKVIFVGPHPKTEEDLSKYRLFLEDKKLNIETDYKRIDVTDLQNIEDVLTDIVLKEKDCIFDLTGGEDLLLVGAGIVYAKFREQAGIKLQQFDMTSGKLLDSDDDGIVARQIRDKISFSDQVVLNGGRIISSSCNKENLTPIFIQTVDTIWKIAKKAPVKWNKMTGALSVFEKHREATQNPLYTELNLPQIMPLVANFGEAKSLLLELLQNLSAMGIVKNLRIKPDRIRYTFSSPEAKHCLAKSGNILELKVFKEAGLCRKENIPYYSDCCTSVLIEWEQNGHFSTKNEIDVCLMHNLTPVFVSCKNGSVKEEELYKLNSVAEEFGGENVKKVLVINDRDATDLGADSMKFFRQRAKSMDIILIENARYFNETQWQEKLTKII